MTKDPAMLSIFVGSSSEKKKIAEYLQDVLQELDSFVKINPWWQTSVFQTGDTHIESLCSAVETTNAAILIFGEDDRTDRRGEASWTTRDNIVLEYGMFAAAHGRNNVMIARVGNPTMPADLAGINCVLLEEADDYDDFKAKNRRHLREWLNQVKTRLLDQPLSPQAMLPRLYEAMLKVVSLAKNTDPPLSSVLDHMAADLFSAMAVSLDTDNKGVNESLADQVMRNYLTECISLSAYETTGPASWVSPTIFRYLSGQIRRYLWANIVGGHWHLVVHDWLGVAIQTAIANARSKMHSESLTIFDSADDFQWEIGRPRLQYSRVLLWTKDELKHPIAESVIAIHEAFNIPLFFVEADPARIEKQLAYLVFEKPGKLPTGLFGKNTDNYRTKPFRNSIPGFGDALAGYKNLVGRKDILFAADARHLLDT